MNQRDSLMKILSTGAASPRRDRIDPALAATATPDLKLISTRVTPEVWRKIKILSATTGISTQRIVQTALEEYTNASSEQ